MRQLFRFMVAALLLISPLLAQVVQPPTGGGGGGGGLSGQTTGCVPLANSSTTSTSSSHVCDNGSQVNLALPAVAPSLITGSPSAGALAALPTGAVGNSCDESSTAGVPASGVDYLRCDSTTHTIKASFNGGSEFSLGSSSVAWPPSAAIPVFSPAAGAIASGTTVTTSCTGGSPYISTGTTAVAGATGIVVSSLETLYGSCQGSGYFTTGSAAYTLTGTTTYVNTTFNEAGSGNLAGTTPATCTNGCTGTWTAAAGGPTGTNAWQYTTNSVTLSGPCTSGGTFVSCPVYINAGHSDYVMRTNVSQFDTSNGGVPTLRFIVRYTDATNFVEFAQTSSGVWAIYDIVAGTANLINSATLGSATGIWVVTMAGTSATLANPSGTTVTGTISGSNTSTKVAVDSFATPGFSGTDILTAFSVKSN